MLERLLEFAQGLVPIKPDGHVHVMPLGGPEHFESKDCWCQPELAADYVGPYIEPDSRLLSPAYAYQKDASA